MPVVIPNIQSAPTYDGQAFPDETDNLAIQATETTTGVVSGMAVTASSALTVAIAAGVYAINGVLFTYAGGTVACATASTTDRRDLISIPASGTVVATSGTACGTSGWTRANLASAALPPVKAACPANSATLAEVYLPGGTTTIITAMITDKRAAILASVSEVALTIPGISPTADNAAIIQNYLNNVSAGGQNNLVLPPGNIPVATTITVPANTTLRGSGAEQILAGTVSSGSVIIPLSGSPPTVLVNLSNNQSGLQDLNVDALTTSGSARAVTLTGTRCVLRNVGMYGGSVVTFDTTGGASQLTMSDVTISTKQGSGAWATTTVQAMIAAGADWCCTNVRATYGTKVISAGGSLWTTCHFTEGSGGNASTSNVAENGSQTFVGCYFDSIAGASITALIDRSGATLRSNYWGCRVFQNDASVTGIPIIQETATAGAGANTGGWIASVSGAGSSFTNFIKGAIASTTVMGVTTGNVLSSTFTDSVPPAGVFVGCQLNGVNVDMTGVHLGSNQQIRAYTTAAAPAYAIGRMYFDTTLNKLRIGGATAWETVTSA